MSHIVVVTGLSGSGKSSAKKCLEDMAYYTIDNLPVPLVSEFLRLIAQTSEGIRNVALVMDTRIGEYLNQLPSLLDSLHERGFIVDLMFLDASNEVLTRRYKETRRRHPLSPDGTPKEGIAKERELLKSLRERATIVIDSSNYNVHQFREHLERLFEAKTGAKKLALTITSFGFRYGVPADTDLVIDVRFLPNPFFKDELHHKTGLDPEVSSYVLDSEVGKNFVVKLFDFLDFLMPQYLNEGKSYLNIGIGCTGGKHRSVAVSQLLAAHLGEKMGPVQVENRDINRI